MTQVPSDPESNVVPDDTPDSLVSLDADEIQDDEAATPEETSRDFQQGGVDSDPASYLNL